MPSRAPILTCRKADNPGNTNSRAAIGEQDGETIVGWLTRLAHWPPSLWHVSACERGVMHLVGYITDPMQALPVLEEWRSKHAGNAHEWEHDGV